MEVSNTRRIVILGKTGTGKSSLANTIFGERLFTIDHTSSSETSECKAETKSVNGRRITLIDTPGFFDTHRSEEEMKPEIVKCITECSPGPHAFLIVLKVEKFTEQEQAVITKINQYFSEEAFKYATVLFTHGDQLDEGQKIEDFVRKNELVCDLVKKCGGRCHVIDNKHWNQNQKDEYRNNQFQVKELLKTIDEIYETNKGGCYTNEMLQAVEEQIQQEADRIRQSSGNMSEEEVREQAEVSVLKKLLIKLAGTATGVLLGALFGVGVGVAVVNMIFHVAPVIPAATGGGNLIPLTVGITAVGAVMGGVRGYNASRGADTILEAAEMAAAGVKGGARSVVKKIHDAKNVLFKPESKQSQKK